MKTVEVVLERDGQGRLHGYVQQRRGDGFTQRGEDMLKKCVYRQIDTAVIEIKRQLMETFRLIEPPKINFTLPSDFEGGAI